MLKYLIQVVQSSLTTSILLAMLFAFTHFDGKQRQKTGLLWGFVVGIASAFVLAVFKHTTVLINREYFNIGILSVAILAEVLFYLLSWDVFKKRSSEFHEKVRGVVYAVLAISLVLYALPDIFLYPTEFVMPGESAFSTDFLFKVIGYLGGLLIVGLAG
ncbi:MAG TPA: hypothetical protein PLL88_10600, partial [Anaerolineaceae bacterium]|nr:hypothetical protein [Anaerolineaceae bacterium]